MLSPMRVTLLSIGLGIVLGVLGTLSTLAIRDDRYTYRTLSTIECGIAGEILGPSWTVVPNQPNPCHFRQARW